MMFILVYVCGIHGMYAKYVVSVWCTLCMSVVSVQMGVQCAPESRRVLVVLLCRSIWFP